MNLMQKKAEPVYELLSGRTGVMANPYYPFVSPENIEQVSAKLMNTNLINDKVMLDYLDGIQTTAHCRRQLLKEQVSRHLSQLGYSRFKDVRFGDKSGVRYESKEVLSLLEQGKPVYILSEKGELTDVMAVDKKSGMLNQPPSPEKKQPVSGPADITKEQPVIRI